MFKLQPIEAERFSVCGLIYYDAYVGEMEMEGG